MVNKNDYNLHLDHIEDLMYNRGVVGLHDSIKFLSSLAHMLSGHTNSKVNVTVKWDGSPAVVVGIHPENGKFFVGTKSVFSSVPKVSYTEQDIMDNYESEGLKEKLKVCLRYLPKLGIKTILQGDILFTHGDVVPTEIDGNLYATFTPNTITYAIPINTPLASRLLSAKLGIIFHTEYQGKALSELQRSFNVDLGYLNNTKDVWYRDASFVDESGTATFTSEETEHIFTQIEKIIVVGKQINHKVLQQLSMTSSYRDLVKIFNNSVIREGTGIQDTYSHTNQLIRWIDARLTARIGEAKRQETKIKRIQEKNVILGFFKFYNHQIKDIFDLQNMIVSVKLMILHKLSQAESTKSFIKTDKGYRVTRPEGFVAVDSIGDAVKIVDRMEFSQQNFKVGRDWKK